MQDLSGALAQLPIDVYRFTRGTLSGVWGYRATLVARLVLITLVLPAIAQSTGVISGALIFATLLIAASTAAFMAFISVYDLEPEKFKNKTRVYYRMVSSGTLMGAIVTVVLGLIVMLVTSVKEPCDLFLYSILHSAVCASLVYTRLMTLLSERMPK